MGLNGLHRYIEMFRSGVHLPENEAESLLDQVISETDDRALVELLNVWKSKGYGESELYGLSKTMRERCVPVRSSHQVFVDAVGTGGSKAKTFNVSTAAAFVIAGAGVPIAKHGNRAATSNSGSADVLAELGVNPAVNAITAERCLEEIGICFMFAPNFHRLSPVLGKVRRDLGFPTIFNNLGPLCNPARAPHQVIGVWDRERLLPTANVLARLGTRHSWIVHGSDGLDEVTLSGPTFVAEIRDGRVKEFEVSPEDFGINARCLEGLKTKSPGESAGQVKAILNGSVDGTAQDLVLINSAAAIYIAGRCETLPDAFMLANESIFSGAALQKLQRLSIATK